MVYAKVSEGPCGDETTWERYAGTETGENQVDV